MIVQLSKVGNNPRCLYKVAKHMIICVTSLDKSLGKAILDFESMSLCMLLFFFVPKDQQTNKLINCVIVSHKHHLKLYCPMHIEAFIFKFKKIAI